MVAVQTDMSSVTVLELRGGKVVKSGDILSGDAAALGTQELYNETRDEHLIALIHERGLSVQEAVEKHFAQLAPAISNK